MLMMMMMCVLMQLFGYNNSGDATEADAAGKCYDINPTAAASEAGEVAINVFAVSAKRQVGEAAGNKRRDVVVQIRRVDELDCYLTVTQRGIISTWSNKVTIIIVIIIIIIIII